MGIISLLANLKLFGNNLRPSEILLNQSNVAHTLLGEFARVNSRPIPGVHMKTFVSKRTCAIYLVWIYLFSFLVACDHSPAAHKLARLPPDAVILAFGDSLTFGTGASTSESYPDVLASLIGRRVINAGIPGEISSDGLRRLPNLLDQSRPNLLILCHGGNDMLRQLDPAALKSNLREMIDQAVQRGIGVILVGVPKPSLMYLESMKIYREVAREFNIPLEENALAAIIKSPALKSDAVHPNAMGYRRMAEALATLLKRHGAV